MIGPLGYPWAGPRDNGHMPFAGHRTVAKVEAALHCDSRFCIECNRTVSRRAADSCSNYAYKAFTA